MAIFLRIDFPVIRYRGKPIMVKENPLLDCNFERHFKNR
jgi:hypothetical protein